MADTMDAETHDDTWDVIASHQETHPVAALQLASYEDFMGRGLQEVVSAMPLIVAKASTDVVHTEVSTRGRAPAVKPPSPDTHVVKLGAVTVHKPTISCRDEERPLYPNTARLGNGSYVAPVYVNVHHRIFGADDLLKSDKHLDLLLVALPVMTRSSHCNLGGLADVRAELAARVAAGAASVDALATYAERRSDSAQGAESPAVGGPPPQGAGDALRASLAALDAAIAAGPLSPAYRAAMEAKLVRHGECINDSGGYFIVKGSERIVVAQEAMALNTVIVQPGRSDKILYAAEVHSGS